MTALQLYMLQRASAALLAPLIMIHVILIFYATSNGLTASEILERTRGNILWAVYYETFVIAAAVHGAIGLRAIAGDWLNCGKAAQSALMWTSGALLLALGTRAVIAVIFPGV